MGEDKSLVSSSYIVFNILDKNILLPKFLLLWFKREEFDRYARYHSWGSARETFSWKDLCKVKIPLPDIKIQESIIAIHDILEMRKSLNEEIKNMINDFCPVAISGSYNNSIEY